MDGEPDRVWPGCKSHRTAEHPDHMRGGDCKFPNVATVNYKCPACLRGRARAHPGHTKSAEPDQLCKWSVDQQGPAGPRGARVPQHEREPPIRAGEIGGGVVEGRSSAGGSSGSGAGPAEIVEAESQRREAVPADLQEYD